MTGKRIAKNRNATGEGLKAKVGNIYHNPRKKRRFARPVTGFSKSIITYGSNRSPLIIYGIQRPTPTAFSVRFPISASTFVQKKRFEDTFEVELLDKNKTNSTAIAKLFAGQSSWVA